MSRNVWLAVGLGAVAVCVGIGVFRQDSNWDLRNYHYYGAWALLSGVSFENIWPAQAQTFLNPLPYVPVYLAFGFLGARTVAAALAAFHALNVMLVVVLARQVLLPLIADAPVHRHAKPALVGSAVVIGVTASVFIFMIGTTLADVTTSTLILGGLALMVAARNRPETLWIIALAGLAFGAASGLKLTNLLLTLGAVAAPWWLGMGRRQAVTQFVAFVVAIVLGFALTHGYWSWTLLERFGSPIYPFYNTIFQSPQFPDYNVADNHQAATSLIDGFLFAFRWAVGDYPGGPSVDARFAAVIVLIGATVVAAIARRRSDQPWIRAPSKQAVPLVMLAVFFVASFVPWVFVFGIGRYVVSVSLISGILVVGLATLIVGYARVHVAALAAAAALVLSTVPLPFGRVPFGVDWFGIRVPSERMAANELFVMIGLSPTAYVIPSLPRDAKFVRVESQLGEDALDPGTPVGQQIAAIISNHTGPIYSLGLESAWDRRERLLEYGLDVAAGPCAEIQNNFEPLLSCPLTRP